MGVQYKIPDYVHISQDCRHLLSRLFVANSSRVNYINRALFQKSLASTYMIAFSAENQHQRNKEPSVVLEELATRTYRSKSSSVLPERQPQLVFTSEH